MAQEARLPLTPITEFSLPKQYHSDRRGPVRWILSHSLPYWPLWLVALTGAFVNAAMAGLYPVFIGQAFNVVLAPHPDLTQLVRIGLLLALTQVSRGVLQFGRGFGFELIAQKVERDVRDELYANLLGKSMTFHNLQPVGDTMARATNDVREVNYLFSPGLQQVFGSIAFLFVPLFIAPQYFPSLIITPIAFIIAYVIALRGYLRRLEPITDDVRLSFGTLNTHLAEALDGIETVKGASQEKAEVARFWQNASQYRDAAVRQGNEEARFVPLLLLMITLAVGLLHALYLFHTGLLNVGQVIGFFGLLLMLDFPTWTSTWAYSRISSGLAGARRILELMARETDLDQNTTGFGGPMRGEIEFLDVTFRYNAGEPVIEHVSFRVEPGQTVAVVGQTGFGKTSLVRLVNRTYDVTSGHVRVDGVDVRDWNLEALRKNISIIEQDIFLFSRSIAENIAFGKPDASHEQIQAAAEAAQAHEFIAAFPQGYDTVIGERGVTLSGGQRQRLALARAFLTDPPILILDDSTSAIDSATEDRIQHAIYRAARGRTTLIITHRLSQIRWADLILVLRKGKLSASGSHEDLMRTSEAYRRIFSTNEP
ncbi:MAG TPA: ABC transporter ATP-binding protein [Anaerolineaceae bacterium]